MSTRLIESKGCTAMRTNISQLANQIIRLTAIVKWLQNRPVLGDCESTDDPSQYHFLKFEVGTTFGGSVDGAAETMHYLGRLLPKMSGEIVSKALEQAQLELAQYIVEMRDQLQIIERLLPKEDGQ